MTSAFQRMLQRVGGTCLIEFDRRPKTYERVAGYVVGFSDSLILVHQLDWDAFILNGYCVIRIADVQKYRTFDKETYWQYRAARRKNFKAIDPETSVATWQIAISAVAKISALLHRGRNQIGEEALHRRTRRDD